MSKGKKKKKAKHEDAVLILTLYELRREEKLREARDWFATQFFPESIEDFKTIFAPGSPHNTHFRMVVSYWDMAASFAVAGALNADLLLESSGELCLVWAKLEKFISQLREESRLPEYLQNIEAVIKMVEWAPDRVKWLQKRFAVFRTQAAQAGAGN
ncbi:MAG TPA: hypothetical protein VFB82_04845 [Blastocatellia bacterium]|jgi:hypothetical protein|nr:hypothetical protein [Blastocatellia bacterium]